MTPQQFHALNPESQNELIENMPHVGERFEPGFTILLFQMDGWLLEAYFHRRAGAIQFGTVAHQWQLAQFNTSSQNIAHMPAVSRQNSLAGSRITRKLQPYLAAMVLAFAAFIGR